jgi:plastocyanin
MPKDPLGHTYDATVLRGLSFFLVVFLVASLVLAGCGGDSDGGPSLDREEFLDETAQTAVTIDAVDNSFRPKYVEISAGTTVTFENRGRNVHDVLPADEGAFPEVEADEFGPGATAQIVFDEPGDVAYYCSLHGTPTAGMIGGIRVVE